MAELHKRTIAMVTSILMGTLLLTLSAYAETQATPQRASDMLGDGINDTERAMAVSSHLHGNRYVGKRRWPLVIPAPEGSGSRRCFGM